MNQLQKEILQAILKDGKGPQAQAEAAAEVCLRWIERKADQADKEANELMDSMQYEKASLKLDESIGLRTLLAEEAKYSLDEHRTKTKETE